MCVWHQIKFLTACWVYHVIMGESPAEGEDINICKFMDAFLYMDYYFWYGFHLLLPFGSVYDRNHLAIIPVYICALTKINIHTVFCPIYIFVMRTISPTIYPQGNSSTYTCQSGGYEDGSSGLKKESICVFVSGHVHTMGLILSTYAKWQTYACFVVVSCICVYALWSFSKTEVCTSLWTSSQTKMQEWRISAWTKMQELPECACKKLKEAWAWTCTKLNSAWAWTCTKLNSAWEWTCKILNSAWEWTCQILNSAWEWTCQILNSAWEWTCTCLKEACVKVGVKAVLACIFFFYSVVFGHSPFDHSPFRDVAIAFWIFTPHIFKQTVLATSEGWRVLLIFFQWWTDLLNVFLSGMRTLFEIGCMYLRLPLEHHEEIWRVLLIICQWFTDLLNVLLSGMRTLFEIGCRYLTLPLEHHIEFGNFLTYTIEYMAVRWVIVWDQIGVWLKIYYDKYTAPSRTIIIEPYDDQNEDLRARLVVMQDILGTLADTMTLLTSGTYAPHNARQIDIWNFLKCIACLGISFVVLVLFCRLCHGVNRTVCQWFTSYKQRRRRQMRVENPTQRHGMMAVRASSVNPRQAALAELFYANTENIQPANQPPSATTTAPVYCYDCAAPSHKAKVKGTCC